MTVQQDLQNAGFAVERYYLATDGADLVGISFSVSNDDLEEYAASLELSLDNADIVDELAREIEDSYLDEMTAILGDEPDSKDYDVQNWSDFETVHTLTFTLAEFSKSGV